MKKIHIEQIQDNEKNVTLIDGKLKYKFWKTKQDGNETKAYTQFKQFGFKSGMTVAAEVKEEAKTFVNEQGKTINFTERMIMFFETEGQFKTPVTFAPKETIKESDDAEKILTAISILSGKVDEILNHIKQ